MAEDPPLAALGSQHLTSASLAEDLLNEGDDEEAEAVDDDYDNEEEEDPRTALRISQLQAHVAFLEAQQARFMQVALALATDPDVQERVFQNLALVSAGTIDCEQSAAVPMSPQEDLYQADISDDDLCCSPFTLSQSSVAEADAGAPGLLPGGVLEELAARGVHDLMNSGAPL
ncbi:uncharacterized protein MONBRDRAFT_38829 [Monosiga brevicollis MX1]|uniref:Uncharacterized protein n=1 Tax=Monosiga brevicollis TaxID=81824 RepID=A9VAE1_MONBE|nr:uncharacterized protein MONBRDRAFT_38829 [Monosiga brevicollis MX1]EDQ85526.1 predicted protein [Monosiga brevicollis MX1]|eukprot:XP_001749717.1 hypothetical protein [Monosiga brevicollis MX1]